MPLYPGFIPCPQTCKSQLHPDDLAAHLQWHADTKAQMALIKVLVPGLNLSVF